MIHHLPCEHLSEQIKQVVISFSFYKLKARGKFYIILRYYSFHADHLFFYPIHECKGEVSCLQQARISTACKGVNMPRRSLRLFDLNLSASSITLTVALACSSSASSASLVRSIAIRLPNCPSDIKIVLLSCLALFPNYI